MGEPTDLRVERLRRKPLDAQEVWQGAVIRMPSWVVDEEERPPYRPTIPIWTSRATGLVHAGDAKRPGESDPEDVLTALFEFSTRRDIECRPSRIEVSDPDLAAHLREALGESDPEIRVVESVDDLAEVTTRMADDFAGPSGTSSALAAPGVDLALMKSFAEAAAEFHRAAPWNHLINEDLVRVENPVNDELGWVSVLGAGGRERGLGFFGSRGIFEALILADDPASTLGDGLWSLSFGPIYEVPIPDADLWTEHGLAVDREDAYPWLARYDFSNRKIDRADGERLAFVEALLRAFARTTEDELDSGRWTKSVPTGAGPREVELSLPYLLEESAPPKDPGDHFPFFDRRLMERSMRDMRRLIEGREFESMDEMNEFLNEKLAQGGGPLPLPKNAPPRERAQEMFYRALDAHGRLRIKLAREALRLDPDCADARVLLAENMPDLARRMELYREAMESGERALEPEPTEGVWGDVEARPYMRARLGYSMCLVEAGRRDEAIEHWVEMLRLNPGDNQGLRWLLAPALIEARRFDEAEVIVRDYAGDIGCTTAYCETVLAFARHGDGPEARAALERALKANPHVPKYLSGRARFPDPDSLLPHFRPGSEDEAAGVVPGLLAPWQAIPGAVKWLGERVRERKRERKEKKRQTKKNKGRGPAAAKVRSRRKRR